MKSRRRVLVGLVALGLLAMTSFLIACDKGPETDVNIRIVISHRWDDPPSFRGIDPKGREYDVFLTDTTEINSGTDQQFTWDDIIQGDDLNMWVNKIPKDPEPYPPHYEAVRLDIAPTTR